MYGIDLQQDTQVPLTGILHVGKKGDTSVPRISATTLQIIDHLKKTYSSRIGFEFDHVSVRFCKLKL